MKSFHKIGLIAVIAGFVFNASATPTKAVLAGLVAAGVYESGLLSKAGRSVGTGIQKTYGFFKNHKLLTGGLAAFGSGLAYTYRDSLADFAQKGAEAVTPMVQKLSNNITYQDAGIAVGACALTIAAVKMARYFAQPCHPLEIRTVPRAQEATVQTTSLQDEPEKHMVQQVIETDVKNADFIHAPGRSGEPGCIKASQFFEIEPRDNWSADVKKEFKDIQARFEHCYHLYCDAQPTQKAAARLALMNVAGEAKAFIQKHC